VYSRLRFLNSAALIAFGIVIAVGVPAWLLSVTERPRGAQTEISGSCLRQILLHFDRSCLASATPRGDLPWMAGHAAPKPVAVESSSATETAPEQPAAGTQDVGPAPQELTRQSDIRGPEQEAALPPAAPAASAATVEASPAASNAVEQPSTQAQDDAALPQELPRQSEIEATGHGTPVQPAAKAVGAEVSPGAEKAVEPPLTKAQDAAAVPQELPSGINAPEQATPVPPPAAAKARRGAKPAKETRVAKPRAETHARLPAPKNKKEDRKLAKRARDEALAAVRRNEDTLHDIPVNAYAPDGTRRNVVIRPTNVQDVYYYSVPR
jgi:hypothetical protein